MLFIILSRLFLWIWPWSVLDTWRFFGGITCTLWSTVGIAWGNLLGKPIGKFFFCKIRLAYSREIWVGTQYWAKHCCTWSNGKEIKVWTSKTTKYNICSNFLRLVSVLRIEELVSCNAMKIAACYRTAAWPPAFIVFALHRCLELKASCTYRAQDILRPFCYHPCAMTPKPSLTKARDFLLYILASCAKFKQHGATRDECGPSPPPKAKNATASFHAKRRLKILRSQLLGRSKCVP